MIWQRTAWMVVWSEVYNDHLYIYIKNSQRKKVKSRKLSWSGKRNICRMVHYYRKSNHVFTHIYSLEREWEKRRSSQTQHTHPNAHACTHTHTHWIEQCMAVCEIVYMSACMCPRVCCVSVCVHAHTCSWIRHACMHVCTTCEYFEHSLIHHHLNMF